MKSRFLIIVTIFALCMNLSAQDLSQPVENPVYRNFVSYDVGTVLPMIIFSAISAMDEYSSGDYFLNTAFQYERQMHKNFSLTGRFSFRGFHFGDFAFNAFTLEAQGRHYPEEDRPFFYGLALGYSLLDYKVPENISGIAHYFKVGGRLGWRIPFGVSRRWVFEPSFGYDIAFGSIPVRTDNNTEGFLAFLDSLLDDLVNRLVRGYIIGGFQISMCLGYSF